MSIIIRIKETGEAFEVPPEFVLQIKNTSPVFNKLGSKSLSASLPLTAHNKRLIEHAHRPERKNKAKTKLPVILSYRSYCREGLLYFNSALNTDHTFSITIAFNEGIMYEEMEDLQLDQLSNLPVVRKNSIEDMIAQMNKYFTEDGADEELSVFTVVVKEDIYKDDRELEKVLYTVINNRGNGAKPNCLHSPTTTQILYENKPQTINVPLGYGISPFIRCWKVLELIFSHFGYTINKNPFKEHYQLKRLCILNNVMDAIVGGVLDYRQLMPPSTAMAFLQSLYCRFGMKVFFDGGKNEVNLILLKDIFAGQDIEHINICSVVNQEETAPRQVKLSAQRNLDKSATETDTYEDFLLKYNNTVSPYPVGSENWYAGIYFNKRSGLFHRSSVAPLRGKAIKIISSIQFDWNKNDKGIEIEEIVGEDECLTMSNWYGDPYFAVSPKLLNSDVVINGKLDDFFEGENKLAFAYDMGVTERAGYKRGSIFTDSDSGEGRHKDKDGNEFLYALTFVGEDGAFNRFFKEYDAFLRHSNNTVSIKALIPLHKLSGMDFHSKIQVGNQLYLADKLDHNLGSDNSMEATFEARTLRLYTPYNLNQEHYLPIPHPIRTQWILCETRDAAISVAMKDHEAYWKSVYPGRFVFTKADPITDDNLYERENSLGDYWLLPPTSEQHGIIIAPMPQTCKCKIRTTINGIGEKFRTYDINYTSYLMADRIV